MDDLDIDGSLPGQELEEEESTEEIRRENDLESTKTSSSAELKSMNCLPSPSKLRS